MLVPGDVEPSPRVVYPASSRVANGVDDAPLTDSPNIHSITPLLVD
ncbi:hypothetical protein SOVF_042900 [Spinacia oleracea]|nr:hypothetical protein SOVF_042900 [Spinacia oleracea]